MMSLCSYFVIMGFFFFFNDTATTEIYTLHIVGSVRCVQETVSTQSTWGNLGDPACLYGPPDLVERDVLVVERADRDENGRETGLRERRKDIGRGVEVPVPG
eukprot:TRINITY_DN3354_c0_g1_i1.p6 TRINITY_DN3354_c0_g1~~TRINITY_DN3354_c0_g1_i1.p6  ORF type:complete len:102 (+),score=28.97 TRINITY_DN3354_c0_g1_i1:89-394(+)